MPHRPARPARLLVPFLALSVVACRGSSPIRLSAESANATPATVLGCVAEVVREEGLPVLERRLEAEAPTLRAQSTPLAGSEARTAPLVDVLTVSVGRAGRGLRAVAQTFRLARATAPATPEVERTAGGTLWQSAAPSARVSAARDAVLDRCSVLGN